MTVVDDGVQFLGVSALIDGGDLTDGQLVIFRAFLEESGFMKVIGIMSERPVTS